MKIEFSKIIEQVATIRERIRKYNYKNRNSAVRNKINTLISSLNQKKSLLTNPDDKEYCKTLLKILKSKK